MSRDDVAAPLRVPAARVRRVPDVQRLLQAGAAGHPRPAHRADGRRDRRAAVPARRRAAPAGAAGDRHRRRAGVRRTAAARPRSTPSWPRATRAAPGSRSSRASRTRGSTWARATASTTTTAAGTTTRASRTRRSSGTSRARARAGSRSARPRSWRASATASPRSYGELLSDEQRGPFQELLGLSRTVFPYVEEHKFYCDYWFLTAWYNKVREFGALLVEARLPRRRRGRLPPEPPRGAAGARGARPALGDRRARRSGRSHWPPIVERRKELLGQARRLDAAAGARHDAGGGQRSDHRDAVGDHAGAPAAVGAATATASSCAAPRPRRASSRARRGWSERRADRRGAGRRDPRVRDHVAGVGADLLPDRRRPSPTSAASCRTRRSCAASTGCRRWSAPAAPPAQIKTGQRIRVDGTNGRVTILDGSAVSPRASPICRLRRRRPHVRRQERDTRRADRGRGFNVPGPAFAMRGARTSSDLRRGRRRATRRSARRRSAVRSSAVGEDSADATFAGQQETLPVGARGRRASATRCATAGRASTARARDQLPRADGRRGRRRWA